MKNTMTLVTALTALVGTMSVSEDAVAANTVDAQLVLTLTLDDVVLNGSSSATFETSSNGVGDLAFADIGPNGYTLAGGVSDNPPGSIGSATAGISYSLNGLDPFVDDYDMDSFGIGDSVVITMNASASATTPGSIFFAQVIDQLTLSFVSFGSDTDQFTFNFSWEAQLTGDLDNTSAPGSLLAFADGIEVNGEDQSSIDGDPFFSLGRFISSMTADSVDEMDFGMFEVAFNPGVYDMTIGFDSELVVNATVEIPEPSSLALLGLGGLCLVRRR